MTTAKSEYNKPLPDVNAPLTKSFWQATRNHILVMQKCPSCGYVRWPPSLLCPECLEENSFWVKLSGRGKVWGVCEYHYAFHPAFKEDLPYNAALVELDEGPMLTSNLVGVTNSKDVKINTPVEAVFADVTPEVTLVKFKLAGQPPAAKRRPR